jgi:hypothetical protein
MHLFGTLGTLMFIIGFLTAGFLGGRKLWYVTHNMRAPLVTDSPWFYIALTVMVIGTLLFLTGFLGELVNRNAPDRNTYLERQRIGL